MRARAAPSLVLAAALCATWAGCDSGGGGRFSGSDPAAVVFQGFQVRWDMTTHRLNKLGAGIENVEASDPSGPTADAVLLFEGGSFSSGEEGTDGAAFEIRASEVSGGGFRFVHGTLPPLEMLGSYATGQSRPAEAQGEGAIDVSGAKSATVVLRSFSLDTDLTHEFGYTTAGFGAGLRNVRREGETLRFEYWAKLEAGSVPDRDQDLESYGATATIGYTAVVAGGPVTRTEVAYEMGYPGGVFPEEPRAPAETQAFEIQGEPGLPAGFVAFEQFDFVLNEGTALFPGRYLREVSARILDPVYDAASGAAQGECDGYFSNSGAVSWPLAVDFRATLVLVQGREEGASTPGVAGGRVTIPVTTLPFPAEGD